MTTPSLEERLQRLSASPGQPATKADIAALRSEMRIRDIELRGEMRRIEHERKMRDIELRGEMRRIEHERKMSAIALRAETQRIEHEHKMSAIALENERQLEEIHRRRHKAERRWEATMRGILALYGVLIVVVGVALATSLL